MADNKPEFPLEMVRLTLQAIFEWAMWKPPGEAVGGELDIEFGPDPSDPSKDEPSPTQM